MRFVLNLLLIITILSNISCQKEQKIQLKEYPYVYIERIDTLMDESITFYAQIRYNGNKDVIDHGFVIKDLALNLEFDLSITKSMGPIDKSQNQFSFTLQSGLIKGMKFSVRAYTKTENSNVFSNEEIFISPVGIY